MIIDLVSQTYPRGEVVSIHRHQATAGACANRDDGGKGRSQRGGLAPRYKERLAGEIVSPLFVEPFLDGGKQIVA